MKKIKLWFTVLSLSIASASAFAANYTCSGWHDNLHVKAVNIGIEGETGYNVLTKYVFASFDKGNGWYRTKGSISDGVGSEMLDMLMFAQSNNLPVSFSCSDGYIDSLYVGQ